MAVIKQIAAVVLALTLGACAVNGRNGFVLETEVTTQVRGSGPITLMQALAMHNLQQRVRAAMGGNSRNSFNQSHFAGGVRVSPYGQPATTVQSYESSIRCFGC